MINGISVYYDDQSDEIIMFEWDNLKKEHRLFNQDRIIAIYIGASKRFFNITNLTKHWKYLGKV